MKKYLLIILAFLLSGPVFSQVSDLRFYREDIQFKIRGNKVSVNGIYFFENISNARIIKVLSYPFQKDPDLYGEISSFEVRDLTGNENIYLIDQNEEEAKFRISLNAQETKHLRITYSQEFFGNEIECQLLTSAQWGKAFEQINFWLETPASMKVTYFSYEPDSMAVRNNNRIYYWHKKEFIPDKNLIFRF